MKSLDENKNYRRNIHARTYRLLETYGKDNNSSSLYLKEGLPINGIHKKIDTTYNEKYDSEKRKQSYVCPSKFAGGHQPGVKNKSCVFETKKYSHLEKKIFKELDYTDFLKNNKTISNKIYKKIIHKKYGLRIVLPVLIFFFLLIIFMVEVSLGFAGAGGLLYQLNMTKENLETLTKNSSWSPILEALKKLGNFFRHRKFEAVEKLKCVICDGADTITDQCILGQFFRFLIYFVPFIILSITVISGIIYYHKKVKKYEKIKFRKR
ncbi:Plasmodium exported protein (Pm-fam-a like), unknown function [Plasmodium malariae]|uniref:Fam-l protein n=1 Tax=Plasmodium malariae TaxID=5858 RepID=A0A1A8WS54_PLAMA|nr:Plasmodium exported protein (Pm-fam-a like), unknown function [Plasmodium malariae]